VTKSIVTRRGLLWLVVGLPALTFGCGRPSMSVAPDRDREIVASFEQRAPEIVLRVDYQPGDDLDPPVIYVVVGHGLSRNQAVDLLCRVVRPALDAAGLSAAPSVEIWDDESTATLADESSCS
jgi:hypothetical protein